ncbi:MAG: hypothetical protein H3C34_09590 [Caldilineaceae bacterium]|nr:hypothetical protein [Caldilineaceae bacterium]
MSHKARAMLIGAVAGAFLGVAFAWVASDGVKDEDGGGKTALQALGPMDYFSLGIAILTLARQFGGMLKKA